MEPNFVGFLEQKCSNFLHFVTVPPTIAVAQRDVYTETGRTATLRCDTSGSPQPVVRWEKEGDQLPAQHRIQNGVLT